MSRKCFILWLCAIGFCLMNVEASEIGTFRGSIVELDFTTPLGADSSPDVVKWAHVQKKVEALEIAHLGLSVADSEVEAAHAERLALVHFDDDAARNVVRIGSAMKEALQKWQANPEQDRGIYESLLMPLDVSLATWESFKKTHGTPESLEKLWVPKDEAAARNAGKESIRNELLRKKLAEHVSGKTIVSEGEVWGAFLRASNPDAKAEDMAALKFAFTQQQVAAALELWMAGVVQKGDLLISSTEYKTAIESRARDISAKVSGASAGAAE